MKTIRSIPIACIAVLSFSYSVSAQTAGVPVPAVTTAPVAKAPLEIVSHKIGIEYYPILDRPSMNTQPITADVGELVPTDAERIARQRTRASRGSVASTDEKRARGRLYSYLRIIDDAQMVQIVIKNHDTRVIKEVGWDFAFPRYENGQLVFRFDVVSKVEIKPEGKKTLKYTLPAGVKKCEVVKVVRDDKDQEKVSTFEAVCGQGFHDPSLEGQKQETISIKRITYADGSVWTPKMGESTK